MRYADLRNLVLDPIAFALSRRELHRRIRNATTLNDILLVPNQYVGRGRYASIRAVQDQKEIEFLAGCVHTLNPRTIVEIGTYKGGTLFIWCRIGSNATSVTSIDLPGGNYGGGYAACRTRLYKEFCYGRPNLRLNFIRGDSQSPLSREQLIKQLNGASVDFLYIDGDHSYDGVKKDYLNYHDLVRPGGLIAFHDIAHPKCGVRDFWTEVKSLCNTEECINSNKGIGVIRA